MGLLAVDTEIVADTELKLDIEEDLDIGKWAASHFENSQLYYSEGNYSYY